MCWKTTRKKEKEYIESIKKKIANEIIRDRIVYLLEWYSKKATWDKRLYLFCASISVIAPATITLINSCFKQYANCLIPIISTFASIVAGILALTRWQEGWIRYRSTTEKIKSNVNLFLQDVQYASSGTIKYIEKDFLKEVEDICNDENIEWSKEKKNKKENN